MKKAPKQHEAFVKIAKELGCDESEEQFDRALRAVASQKPQPRPAKKPSAKTARKRK